MSILSDYQSIFELHKLRNGKSASLSVSQVVNMITNMSEAKKNLPPEQFQQVYKLFKEFRECNTKLALVMDTYLELARDIIRRFDAIAPFEKYCGGNELEFSLMMQEIRGQQKQHDIQDELFALADEHGTTSQEYINYLLTSSNMLTHNQAKAFVGVLVASAKKGSAVALKMFKDYIKYLIDNSEENPAWNSDLRISICFLCGALSANGVISEPECYKLTEYYNVYLDHYYE